MLSIQNNKINHRAQQQSSTLTKSLIQPQYQIQPRLPQEHKSNRPLRGRYSLPDEGISLSNAPVLSVGLKSRYFNTTQSATARQPQLYESSSCGNNSTRCLYFKSSSSSATSIQIPHQNNPNALSIAPSSQRQTQSSPE